MDLPSWSLEAHSGSAVLGGAQRTSPYMMKPRPVTKFMQAITRSDMAAEPLCLPQHMAVCVDLEGTAERWRRSRVRDCPKVGDFADYGGLTSTIVFLNPVFVFPK